MPRTLNIADLKFGVTRSGLRIYHIQPAQFARLDAETRLLLEIFGGQRGHRNHYILPPVKGNR